MEERGRGRVRENGTEGLVTLNGGARDSAGT